MQLLLSALCVGMATAPLSDSFHSQVEKLMKERNIPGLSVVVSERGKVIFSKGYGYANVEHGIPMKASSVHELASVSKQFTAACILLLKQDGKLKLDDRLKKFFPDAGDAWNKVTIHHLLNHTSGLPDYLEKIQVEKEYTQKQMVDSIKDKPLKFEPGKKWEYSNSGYAMLGFIVEKVSQKGIGEFMQTRIFKPLGMNQSYLNDTMAIIPNRADGYTLNKGKVVREGYTSPSLCHTGDGQVMSSALDLAKWDAALHGDQLLNEESKRLMFTPCEASKRVAPNGQTAGYGYGFAVVIDKDKKLHANHSGGWMGTNTFVQRSVSDGRFMALLINFDAANSPSLLNLFMDRFKVGPPRS